LISRYRIKSAFIKLEETEKTEDGCISPFSPISPEKKGAGRCPPRPPRPLREATSWWAKREQIADKNLMHYASDA
jgi:hypothetical protein